jgi:hypothetical protein
VKEQIGQDPSRAAAFMLAKLDEELKRLHNPTWQKTKKLFEDYLQIDVTIALALAACRACGRDRAAGHTVEEAWRRGA